jgi:hypothetical protein
MNFLKKSINKKVIYLNYFQSLLYRAAKAKLIQLNGDIDLAIGYYNKIIDLDKEMFHKAAHWELMWCFAVKCDWDQCIRYAKLLNEHTLHSPAITTYLDAVFRYVKGVEDNDERLKEEATNLFELSFKKKIFSIIFILCCDQKMHISLPFTSEICFILVPAVNQSVFFCQ